MARILGGAGVLAVACVGVAPCPALADAFFEQALTAVSTGDEAAAEALLPQLVAQQPNQAGAWLDIAVLFCGAGYTRQALALFDAIEQRFHPPAGIGKLIALQRAGGCVAMPRGPVRPSWGWQVGRGHESNVNQGVDDLSVTLPGAAGPLHLQLTPNYAARSDAFTSLALDATWPEGVAGVQLQLDWQSRWYDAQHAYDAQTLTVGVVKPWHGPDWRGSWELGLGWLGLGGAMYQRTQGLRVRASPLGGLGAKWRTEVSGGWGRVSYATLAGFDARWWDARAAVSYARPGLAAQASVAVLRDEGQAVRPGGNRSGWSVDALLRWPLGNTAVAELGGGVQVWQDAHAYSPGVIDERRYQDTVFGRAAVVWPTGPEGQWMLELRQVRNNENIALFGYDTLSLRLAYQRRWGI